MKRTLMLLFLLILSLQMRSQGSGDKPLRIELRAKSDQESHHVIPFGEAGVVLFYLTNGKENDSTARWYFSFYDQNLKPKWSKNLNIPDGLVYAGDHIIDGNQVMLFVPDPSVRNEFRQFAILLLNPVKGEFNLLRGSFPAKSEAVSFDITREIAVIGYNRKNDVSGLLIYNFGNHSLTDVSAGGENSRLTGVFADTINRKILYSQKKTLAKNKYEFFLNEADFTGRKLSEMVISPENTSELDERNILDVNVFPADEADLFIYGSYRSGSLKQTDKGTGVIPATGIYLMKFKNGQKAFSRFVNFLELKNLTIGGKNISGAMKKKASHKKGDETEYSIDYSVLFHPAMKDSNSLMLIGELFTPQFHIENYTDFDFYGRPYTNSYKVFDGYRFSNGVLISFSNSGELQWDNDIEMINLVSYDLMPKITLTLTDSAEIICYLSQGKIGYKITDKNSVLENLDFAPLELPGEGDKLISESRQTMEKWYGNYFLCYGYQEIKNINASEDKKRLVFYLTKVQFN